MTTYRWMISGAVLGGLALSIAATTTTTRAFASTSSFSWKMMLREVDGSRNRKLYHLDSGTLSISGSVWVTEKVRGANSAPLEITVEILRDEFGRNASICSLQVQPSTILNERRDFSRSCGRVESGTYYLVVAKPHGKDDVDGWHNEGSGSLTTK